MLIEFDEHFHLRAEEAYPYFRSPRDWPRLYGSFGEVEDRGGGWFAVPLRGFPFPLVARMTTDDPNRRVAWTFKGFWRGKGEVAFIPADGGVTLRGFERISVRPLACASGIAERLFLERKFRQVWAYGWHRLRQQAEESTTSRTGTKPR